MTFQSADQLARRIRDHERTIRNLRRDKRELERRLEDARGAWIILPATYAEALLDLHHIATTGVKRDEAKVDAEHATSRPPQHDPDAYRRLESEQRHLRRRAEQLGAFVSTRIDAA